MKTEAKFAWKGEASEVGYDVYLSWDGMTLEDERAQDVLWDIRFGHVGYLRAGLSMKREIRLLSDIFPDVPWWEGPPREGKATLYDFATNFTTMKRLAEEYLKDRGASKGMGYFLSLPMRSKVPESEDENLNTAENWVRSIVDFFNLGAIKQKQGKNPRVEIT